MKTSTLIAVVAAGLVGAVVGGLAGGSWALSRSETSAVAWHWLDASAMLANADGSAKSAEQQRDSLNGSFVAQTGVIAGVLGSVDDSALRHRVLERARALSAHPDAIADTPLTLGQREAAVATLHCMANAANPETAGKCAGG